MVSSLNSRSYTSSVGRLLEAAATAVAANRHNGVEEIAEADGSAATNRRGGSGERPGGDARGGPDAETAAAETVRRPHPGAAARPYAVQFDPTKGVAASRLEGIVSRRAERAYEAGRRVSQARGERSGAVIDTPT